ncbi:MAG TPA: cytochrome c, partial [Bryobacteraceae bacterium]|nr:cytochrome c [Bryobacteraceae bacterium]
MKWKPTSTVALIGSGLFVSSAQQATELRVFTSAQAESGRVTYERTCGRCHTPALSGRTGDKGELPSIDSLPASYQKFIKSSRGVVPPLAGKVFLDRWGGKTAAELIARFQITADDPFFQFEDMDAESTVDITAYVLQVNGAKSGTQPLTRATGAIVNSA